MARLILDNGDEYLINGSEMTLLKRFRNHARPGTQNHKAIEMMRKGRTRDEIVRATNRPTLDVKNLGDNNGHVIVSRRIKGKTLYFVSMR